MNVEQTIQFLRDNGLTYCGRAGKLETVHRLARQVEADAVPGIFLEAGVAMGGSACVIAKTKGPKRELWLYDVFEMLPPPSENDDPKSYQTYQYFISGNVQGAVDRNYVSHAKDLLLFTRHNMQRVGIDPEAEKIAFVKGLYQDTLTGKQPVAFAHIDCDWYDSVVLCIERLSGRISPKGIMLFDDYNSFSGCRMAVDRWLERDSRFKIVHADWTVAVQRTG